MVMLSAANLTTLASRREVSKKFFLHLYLSQPTFACITFSQIQEITRSFPGSGLTRNILDCSLALNVITAAVFNTGMR